MKMNTLRYIIRYLQRRLVDFKVAIYKEKTQLAKCEDFEHVEPTIINMIKRFHL